MGPVPKRTNAFPGRVIWFCDFLHSLVRVGDRNRRPMFKYSDIPYIPRGLVGRVIGLQL
jgi:hypothetical protein